MTLSSSQSSRKDAVSLLIHDHKEVKNAFKDFEALGDRAFVAKKKLADDICLALIIHATVEEEIFYPAVRKQIKGSGDMLDEANVEHASAKELMTQILAMSSEDDLFDAKVKVLAEQNDHHVCEEEEGMFVKARTSEMDLMALGKEISALKEALAKPVSSSFF